MGEVGVHSGDPALSAGFGCPDLLTIMHKVVESGTYLLPLLGSIAPEKIS
jgi:hypothetical protein